MKKLLAVLLTFILTFSCFSTLSVGTVSAEENQYMGQVIMQSDFKTDYESGSTNWVSTLSKSNHVEIKKDETKDEYFARVFNNSVKTGGMFSTPFELVPNNEYELSFYYRIPEQERAEGFIFGNIHYQPSFAIFDVTANADKTAVVPAKSLNNSTLYSYSKENRRDAFESNWTIDIPNKSQVSFGIHGRSSVTYNNPAEYVAITKDQDATEVYADWTKITIKFIGVAAEEGETSQIAAAAFYFLDVGSDQINFDIKDVTLTETTPKINPEPELPEGTVFYEGFENITQAELEALITNRTWSKPTLASGDAATGLKAAALRSYWEYLFIPVDKSKLEAGKFYEFSMDWKMKIPTLAKRSNIENVAFVGYNPSKGETIKKDADTFAYKANLYGTGNWENVNVRFRVTNLNSHEQFGILIRYVSSEPYDVTDMLYIDTLMIALSENQSTATQIDLYEAERTDDTIKVLAFGNSFSADAANYIDDIAKADGKDIRVGNSVIGGCSLERHHRNMLSGAADYDFSFYSIATANSQRFEKVSMQQILEATDWDYIVIQQVSQDSGMSDTFEPYLGELLAYFKEKCPNVKFLFHTTWAYAQDSTHSGFVNYDNDQATMHEAIEDAYLAASARYGYLPLIPTGEAIRRARATSMGDTLNRDGFHLNDKGRMIASLVWYEIFTGISALDAKVDLTKLKGTIGDTGGIVGFVTEEESALMRTAAHEAVQLFKLANETQLAIEAIGTVNANSGEKIETAKALRAALNDDTLLPNLQTLLDAIEAFKAFDNTNPDDTVIKGDVDGVEGITDADAEYLLMYTFFPEDYPITQDCDLDGDGAVTDADAEYLLMYTFFPEDYPIN